MIAENLNDPCGLRKPLSIDATFEPEEFTSPGYPSNYGNSLDCEWLIESAEESSVQISFTFFDVESG